MYQQVCSLRKYLDFTELCLKTQVFWIQCTASAQNLITDIRKCKQILIVSIGSNNQLLMDSNINASTLNINEEEADKKDQIQPISFKAMFRFANQGDYILMAVGTVCACAMGTALPAFALLWGSMTNSFGNGDTMVEASKQVMFKFIYIGVACIFAGWGMFGCWMITGERQGIACRKQYLKSLLKQEIGWFDTINQSELATKFATDCFAYQGAIGQKVSTVIMTLAMFVAGFVIAFYTGWLMTLVSLCGLPALGLGGYLYATAITNKDKAQEKQYAQAGGMAEQAFAAIKTVKQLNGQQFQADRYSQVLKLVTDKAFKYGAFLGVGMGALFMSMLISYALGFWFGSECVEGTSSCPPSLNGGNKYSAGDVLVIFFSILMAGFNLSQLTPSLKKITQGRCAAARIFKIIDRQPLIFSIPNAIKPTTFRGVFRFEKVTFAYPTDKSKNILQNLNLVIDSQSVGFVGQSGCGKSTIFQLLMRFYDPDEGKITLDGVDLRDIDLYWLRDQIGYVGQEPVLFATSLRENLLFGKQNATDEEINDALKKAEAYEFVQNLKDKLQTYVGTGGGQISGGQKQRIAIARAILKNPKVLLLDEATSALDRRNQKLIQNTLNKIAQEKITITIAHRVKTIMNCNQIYVLERGTILQQGKFHELNRYKDNKDSDEKEEAEMTEVKNIKYVPLDSLSPDRVQQQPKQQLPKDIALVETEQPLTQEEREKKQQEQLVKKYDDSIFGRLFSYCSDRKLLFIVGILFCIINGGIFPVFSIFLSKMLAILIDFQNDPSGARRDANTYALIYLLLGILSFFVNLVQQTIFNIIGEEMTQKIRNQTYLKILKMPVIWFDKPRNSSGSLSARLASDCQTVNGLTTTYVAILAQNLTNLIAGITIAFVYEWRTSLVALGLIPFMIASGAIQMAFTTGFSAKTDSAYKDSSNLITEAMINIRTVTSFGYEDMIERKFSSKLKDPLEIGIKKGNISGILYGLSQMIMFVVFALIFYLGSIFMRDNNLGIANVFTAIYAIMFAGMTAGNNSHFMPDVAAGKNSAANIFEVLDGEDEDQLQIKEESKMLRTPITGHLQLIDVDFKYQTREEYVFKNMNLEIPSGWKVGFVGPSGCGKSTIHQLLQRFYEPTKGQILLDGVNLRDYDIHFLRSSLGVVSQQPVLFKDTIGNNIKYNKYDATRQEIVVAANESNFNPENQNIEEVQKDIVDITLSSNKKDVKEKKEKENSKKKDGKGFDKDVGVKGTHISGGQKQRVAIARVILRHPSVLLLDEATSALDSANEKIVQESLDRIMKNKTAINIAHRIDTIRNSNQIMVFEKGRIIEKGTYNQLIAKRGYFYKLQKGLQFV